MLAVDGARRPAKVVHPRDAYIAFVEETHVYYRLGADAQETAALSADVISVTTLIHAYAREFDAEERASKMVENPKFPRAEKYKEDYGFLLKHKRSDWVELIKTKWATEGQESREQGTMMHANLEDLINAQPLRYPINVEYEYGCAFLQRMKEERGLVPFHTEWMIYSDFIHGPRLPEDHCRSDDLRFSSAGPFRLAGSIDLILAPEQEVQNGKVSTLVLGDWKRAKKMQLINQYGTMQGTLNAMPGCNYAEYSLQLNIYKRILEQFYDYRVIEMILIQCHPKEPQPLVVYVDDHQDAVDVMFECRRRALQPPEPDHGLHL